MENPEGENSLHRCGMCGSCGKLPWWAPEVLKTLEPRERIRIRRRLEDRRRAFVAAREEAAAKKAASEAASAALKAFAASKPSASMSSLPQDANSFELSSSMAAPHSAPPQTEQATTPATSVLQSMKPKQEAGFGDDNDASLEKIQAGLKKKRESVLASIDSDIDSDNEDAAALSFSTPKTGNKTNSASPTDEGFYTPKTTDSAILSSKPEAISLDGKAPNGRLHNPMASPGASTNQTDAETPELEANGHGNKAAQSIAAVPTTSADLGMVSLSSSPDALKSPMRGQHGAQVPVKELKVPPLQPESNLDQCQACEKANSRIHELESHVEALQCALKARELVTANRKPKQGVKGETQRLRDEIESLRLTVDFLFRKLQKHETSLRDQPETH